MATLSFEDNINKQLEGFDTNDFFTVSRIQPLLTEAFSQPKEFNPFKSIEGLLKDMQLNLNDQLGLPSGDIDIGLKQLLDGMFSSMSMSLETKSLLLLINDMVCNGLTLPKFNLGKLELLLLGLMVKFYLCEGKEITAISLQSLLIKSSNLPSIGETLSFITQTSNSLPLTHHTHTLNAEWDVLNQEFMNGLSSTQLTDITRINQLSADEELLTTRLSFMLESNNYSPTRVNYDNAFTEAYASNFDYSKSNLEREGIGDYNDLFIKGYVPVYTIGLPFSIAYQGTNIKGINDLIGKRKEIIATKKEKQQLFEQSLSGESLDKHNALVLKKIEIESTDNERVSLKKKREVLLKDVEKGMVGVNTTVVNVMNLAVVNMASELKPEMLKLALRTIEDFYTSDASNSFKDLKPNIRLLMNTFFSRPFIDVTVDEPTKFLNVVEVKLKKKNIGPVDKQVIAKLLRYQDKLDNANSQELYIEAYGSNYYDKINGYILEAKDIFSNTELTKENIYRLL